MCSGVESSMAVPFIESSASKISGEKGYYVMSSQKKGKKNNWENDDGVFFQNELCRKNPQ